MQMLSVVDRELRVSARRRSTYWIRLVAALAALAISAWLCLWGASAQPQPALGKTLFAALTALAFGYGLLSGPFITADSVSEEKRDGTLGLLFLTNLNRFDVVLGKWIATSMAGFYGLLGILPWLGLPLLLGGVTPGEYGRVALAIVNAVLFSLTAGLFVSSVSREQPKAIIGSAILILAIAALVPGACALVFTGPLGRGAGGFPPVALASPAFTGFLALDQNYRANVPRFWVSLALGHAWSWLFMILTAVVLPRVWREDPAEGVKPRRWLLRFGHTRGWGQRLKRRLELNPVFAVASRHRWMHWVFWVLVGLVTFNVYWLTYGYRRAPSSFMFHTYFATALYFINRIWITVLACRFFLEARRSGALELILTTPIPIRTVLRGHWRALRRVFVWPVLAIALLHVGYVYGNWLQYGTNRAAGALTLQYNLLAAGGSLVSFVGDVFALCWVGAWLSVSMRKANLAVLTTFTLVTLVPYTIGHFLPATRLVPTNLVLLYWVVRPATWLLKNLLFIAWAAWRLRRHFRTAAAQTYRPAWPRWRWPGSEGGTPAPAPASVGTG